MFENKDVRAGIATALERIRHEAFSCRFDPAPANGSFDFANDKLALATDGGELDLVAVSGTAACTAQGYYQEGENLALCPGACTLAKAQAKPSVLVKHDPCEQ